MPPGPKPTPIRIAPSVRAVLKQTVRTATAPHREVLRARIVLLAAAGFGNATIGRRIGCDEDTVREWRSRFAAHGTVGALADARRSGRPPKISAETRIELIKLACTPPTAALARTHWSLGALRRALYESTRVLLSESEIGRILRNGELRPHRYRLWLHSPDPKFRAKVRTICRLYRHPPPGATVLCVDEKTQMQALQRRFSGRVPLPGQEGRYEFEYRRRGVLALIAAYNVRTGHVFGHCRRQRKASDLLAFMDAVARHYPDGPVYIVWDNLDIHRDGADKRWTRFNERHGHRFHFVYTPKHASWMNQIEIWFSLLQRRVLRFGDFVDRADLRRKVERFLHRWNHNEAHPFRWTFRGRFAHDPGRPHAEAPRRLA
jgi:transposase